MRPRVKQEKIVADHALVSLILTCTQTDDVGSNGSVERKHCRIRKMAQLETINN
jgi:hypothetical protein